MSAQITFDAPGTVVSASGNSAGYADILNPASLPAGAYAPQNLSVLIRVTAINGTPSLTVEVQWSNDGTNFVSATTADTFTALTAVGTALKTFNIKGRFARLKYTFSSTVSATVDITGIAA